METIVLLVKDLCQPAICASGLGPVQTVSNTKGTWAHLSRHEDANNQVLMDKTHHCLNPRLQRGHSTVTVTTQGPNPTMLACTARCWMPACLRATHLLFGQVWKPGIHTGSQLSYSLGGKSQFGNDRPGAPTALLTRCPLCCSIMLFAVSPLLS